MQSRYTVTVDKHGELQVKAGKAAPRLLPTELRQLPGDLVTKDVDDPNRVHELDEPHIREALVDEWAAPPQEDPKPQRLDIPQDTDRRLTQWKVDIVRMRVLRALAQTALNYVREGYEPSLPVNHLWFPYDDINVYELRRGNPPPDRPGYRPKRLRGLRLELDLTNPYLPDMIEDALRQKRIQAQEERAQLEAHLAKLRARDRSDEEEEGADAVSI